VRLLSILVSPFEVIYLHDQNVKSYVKSLSYRHRGGDALRILVGGIHDSYIQAYGTEHPNAMWDLTHLSRCGMIAQMYLEDRPFDPSRPLLPAKITRMMHRLCEVIASSDATPDLQHHATGFIKYLDQYSET
jgi:hypothetical protein